MEIQTSEKPLLELDGITGEYDERRIGEKKSMDTEQLAQDAEKAIEREQSHTSKLLEHHLKLLQLERKVTYAVTRLDEMEERKREMTKALTLFCCGVCYGLLLVWIFSS